MNGKKIRDVIHGDIDISSKFLALIDTTEFQRLRRIRQLATAESVFPGAGNTRFSHSLGVFSVMQRITNHFERYFQSLGNPYDVLNEEEKNAILVAALLHDIGHGPFSHAFEGALKEVVTKHEDWTVKILEQEDTQIHQALKKNFGDGFIAKVIKYIRWQHYYKRGLPQKIIDSIEEPGIDLPQPIKDDLIAYVRKQSPSIHDEQLSADVIDYISGLPGIDKFSAAKLIEEIRKLEAIRELENKSATFQFIFGSLISSELDADRMDYLLRDAVSSGVTYGQIDLEKLISGMQISVDQRGEFQLCINKKYLPDLEEYFYARYQMYQNVYFHPYKLYSETLLKKIIRLAYDLYRKQVLSPRELPEIIKNIFRKAEISVKDYCLLDDHVVMGAIRNWAELAGSTTQALSLPCRAFLNRGGFKKVDMIDYDEATVDHFLKALGAILGVETDQLIDMPFLVYNRSEKNMYNPTNKVYIINQDGSLQELSTVSAIINSGVSLENKINNCALYCHQELLSLYLEETFESQSHKKMEQVMQLIEKTSGRRHIEIEKKYILEETEANPEAIVPQITGMLASQGYDCREDGAKQQKDVYYDTTDWFLRNNKCTLRIREKKDQTYITCKCPIRSDSSGIYGQFERYEEEERIETNNLTDHHEFIEHRLGRFIKNIGSKEENPLISDTKMLMQELQPVIEISNTRQQTIITKNQGQDGVHEEVYEMAFDDVSYHNLITGKSHAEFQLEIELKSHYKTRVNMKKMTDLIESEFKQLCGNVESKYERAYKTTL